jgi:hypothetical protein
MEVWSPVVILPALLAAHQRPGLAGQPPRPPGPIPPGRGGTPPLALEVRLDAVAAVLMDGLSSRRAARMVGICKTEVGDSLALGRADPSFSAPTIARVAALMLDKNPRSATDIPPASVTVTLSPTGPVTRYSNAGR